MERNIKKNLDKDIYCVEIDNCGRMCTPLGDDFCDNFKIKECIVNGEKMYCTELRMKQDDIPDGWHKADIRHDDEDWCKPSTYEPFVMVNHWGTLISDKPFEYKDSIEFNGRKSVYTEIESFDCV